ncbi:hypothetical protein SARC_03823 [Sphaeroforma arctica JP610]|uniref:Uncharacterized protein n=1 Tax=Sphaeroforma arctica JP610 TaxID=667725 RepID=A0A0L0G4V7_9EUKA|nr:hypothetical protein SARC_03823 [Sphaeroforma arctica JP610]KNC83959.1 hypothetical protein SARC_03823 [Sphaeroforma arctica JP610]|eukprot:XP_014157861.1 hypothetical protein SARC_03823 [Sphaeroforma arctica JP610]
MEHPTTDESWCIVENCPAQIDTEANDIIGISSIHVVGDRTVAGTFLIGVANTQTVYNSIPNEYRWTMNIGTAYSTSDVAKIRDLVKPVLQATLGSRGISTIDSGIMSTNADLKYAVYIVLHMTSTAERAVSSLISSHSAATRFAMNKYREIFSVPAAMAKSLLDEIVQTCHQVSAGGFVEEQRLAAELERIKEVSSWTTSCMRRREPRSALRASEEARKAAEDVRLDLSQRLASSQAQLIELAMLAPARKRVKNY